MRLSVLAAIAASTVALAAPAAAQTAAAPKFAYIDSRIVMDQAPGRAEAAAQYEKDVAGYRQQVQRMGDSLQTLIAAYEKDEISLSPAVKETRTKAIRDREAQYNERTQKLNEQAQRRQEELLRPITERVKKAIDDIRAEEGYAMIFDVGSGATVVVAADRNLDLTEKVVARVKTLAAAPGGATRPTAQAPASGAPLTAPAGVTRPKNPNQR
jgi:outer membrane protein